ncbi:MAG: hypothetical protein A2033_13425 [Bacteroidetes bacterium GWA2_31_9]|nr:MAG: hypothetical protein A2033_13425 [Bacteroidetes bacterium GWA2_31_9]
MCCKKKFKFKESCQFYDLYSKNSLDLPLDDNELCVFHSNNIKWQKEHGFTKELKKYISIANKDDSIETISFAGCNFVSKNYSPEIEGILEICNIKFLKFIEFSEVNFIAETIFKNCSFSKGIYFSGTKSNGLSFIENSFDSIQIDNCLNTKDIIFLRSILNKEFSMLNCEIHGQFIIGECEMLDHISFRRVIYKVHTYSQEELEPIYLPVHFYDIKFKKGFKFFECKFEIGLNIENCEFNSNCEFVDTLFSIHEPVKFENIIVNDNLYFVGSEGNKLFNYISSLDLKINGKVYFENVNLIYLDEKSFTSIKLFEKQQKVNIGKGCLKYKYRTHEKLLKINNDLQNLVIEFIQTFVTFFIKHNGKNLGFEILHKDSEKVIYYYFSDQQDITQEEFEKQLEKTEIDLWSFIRNPEILYNENILRSEKEGKSKDLKQVLNTKFIEKFIYAKDALVNSMSLFFKIGARIQHKKITEDEISKIISSIHFGESESDINGKVIYQIIINNYNNQQLIGVNKNNIEINGNNNIAIQKNSMSK